MTKKIKDTVRVVCYLPVEVNQRLQAQASLEGKSKMDLVAEVLQAYSKDLRLSKVKQN